MNFKKQRAKRNGGSSGNRRNPGIERPLKTGRWEACAEVTYQTVRFPVPGLQDQVERNYKSKEQLLDLGEASPAVSTSVLTSHASEQ